MSNSRPVRVRFAPSPTGDLHIGGVRTAMFNWLFAKHFGGKFILRIEDTDQERFKEGSLDGILNGLRWAGLLWDEGPDIGGPYGPYIQSQRTALYQKWANWLVEHDKAYKTYETPEELELIAAARRRNGEPGGYDRRGRYLTDEERAKYEAEGRKPVIRLKFRLNQKTVVIDMVRGPIPVNNDDLQDQVLLKSDGFPTYHLANVVDDHFMEISHVIRGDEWISTAPLHKLLYEAFGWDMPEIAHAPIILHPDGGKISKRKHPEASISYFMNGGYFPEAVTNFLCNVGWNYGVKDDKGQEIQIFSKEDAARIFDITRMSVSGTKFDVVKLQWLNGEYVRLVEPAKLAQHLRPYLEAAGLEVNVDTLLKIIPLVRERIKVLPDVVKVAGFFFKDDVTPDPIESLIPKKMDVAGTRNALKEAHTLLAVLPDWDHAHMEGALRPLAEQLGLSASQLFTALRVATTGQTVSPPLFETLEVIGKEISLTRIDAAIALLEKQTTP